MTRLAIVVSHPIQYYAPLFRELARRVHLKVFFCQQLTANQQGAAGFGQAFDWDVDLLSGYASEFLENVSPTPGPSRFSGADTPDVSHRLAQGGFDAVLVFGWYLKSLVQAVWAAKRQRLPVMVRGDSHLLTPRPSHIRAAKALIYPPLLRSFDAALYVGQQSRAFYRRYGYPAERLFFSPHCVDTAWFAERASAESRVALRMRLGVAPGEKVVLFAGKLLPIKRPLDLVEACGRDPARRTHLVVAGSGELEAAMRERANQLGLRFHCLGFLNQSQMPAAYAAADVFALPSESETWGLSVNEALACGVPVVVSDVVGCAPDLAADGVAGRVYPVGDIIALARTIEDMLTRPPTAAAIAARSDAFGLAAAADGVEAALAAVTPVAR